MKLCFQCIPAIFFCLLIGAVSSLHAYASDALVKCLEGVSSVEGMSLVNAHRKMATEFYDPEGPFKDPYLGIRQNIRGKPDHKIYRFKGKDVPSFHHIHDGGAANASVVIYDGKVRVMKQIRSENPDKRKRIILKELAVNRFLIEKGFKVPKIIDYSIEEGTIIKELVPGVSAWQLYNDPEKTGLTSRQITKAKEDYLGKAVKGLNDLQKEYYESGIWKEYWNNPSVQPGENHDFFDIHRGNFVYFGGEWYFVDP